MTPIATSSLRLVRSLAMLCVVVALTGCNTFHPVNARGKSSSEAVSERSDSEMRPDHLLAECRKLRSGGTYRLSDGPEDKEVTFFLDRSSGDTMRKLQGLVKSFEFTLSEKRSHAAVEPEAGVGSLWMELTPADGGSELRLILNGTSIITSDQVSDWHWSGGSAAMYSGVIEALAPTEGERHVEKVTAGSGTVDEPPVKVPQ